MTENKSGAGSAGYNVAFRYTRKAGKAGGYEGVIFWTFFKSKEDFDAWYTPEIKNQQTVLAEGISDERCVELTRQTPVICLILAAVEESLDFETGEINPEILRMELETHLHV